jgi:hypothetical protein
MGMIECAYDQVYTRTQCRSGMPEVAEGKGCNWLTRGHTP